MMDLVRVNYINIIKSTSPFIKPYVTPLINDWAQVKFPIQQGNRPYKLKKKYVGLYGVS